MSIPMLLFYKPNQLNFCPSPGRPRFVAILSRPLSADTHINRLINSIYLLIHCMYWLALPRIVLLLFCGANLIGQPTSQPANQPASEPTSWPVRLHQCINAPANGEVMYSYAKHFCTNSKTVSVRLNSSLLI